MKGRDYLILIISLSVLLLSSCKSRNGQPGIRQTEVQTVLEKLDYTPKTTFTGMEQMSAKISEEEAGIAIGEVSKQFLEGCYYIGDTSTPFLASFAEWWNRLAFLRRFASAEEVFERVNTNIEDSLTTETVRGTISLLPDEYDRAFRDKKLQSKAKELVRLFRTIDYTAQETQKMYKCFMDLAGAPYQTPDFITEEDKDAVDNDYWVLYDKSKYVENYESIRDKRKPEEVDEKELEKMSLPLQHAYINAKDFDAKCIYALEMGCYGFPEVIDYLGELIEDGRYSKYLFEVWISWRLRAQASVFGRSTWSEIPDNLYDNARLLVAQTYVRHIIENPSDAQAKYFLMALIYTENLHRAGGLYGNEAMAAEVALRTQYFLPVK